MTMSDMEIRAEYTGTDPNLRPAASAFARMMKNVTNPDGTFADPELEAEYLEWKEKQKEPLTVRAPAVYVPLETKGVITLEL